MSWKKCHCHCIKWYFILIKYSSTYQNKYEEVVPLPEPSTVYINIDYEDSGPGRR